MFAATAAAAAVTISKGQPRLGGALLHSQTHSRRIDRMKKPLFLLFSFFLSVFFRFLLNILQMTGSSDVKIDDDSAATNTPKSSLSTFFTSSFFSAFKRVKPGGSSDSSSTRNRTLYPTLKPRGCPDIKEAPLKRHTFNIFEE